MNLLTKKQPAFDPALPEVPHVESTEQFKRLAERAKHLQSKNNELADRRRAAIEGSKQREAAEALAEKVLSGRTIDLSRRKPDTSALDELAAEETILDLAGAMLTRERADARCECSKRIRAKLKPWYSSLIREILRKADDLAELAKLEQEFRAALNEARVEPGCDLPLGQLRRPVLLVALHPLGSEFSALNELRQLADEHGL